MKISKSILIMSATVAATTPAPFCIASGGVICTVNPSKREIQNLFEDIAYGNGLEVICPFINHSNIRLWLVLNDSGNDAEVLQMDFGYNGRMGSQGVIYSDKQTTSGGVLQDGGLNWPAFSTTRGILNTVLEDPPTVATGQFAPVCGTTMSMIWKIGVGALPTFSDPTDEGTWQLTFASDEDGCWITGHPDPEEEPEPETEDEDDDPDDDPDDDFDPKAKQVFGACELAKDHKYGTPSQADCLDLDDSKQEQDLSALDTNLHCCYTYLVEDPWLVVQKKETSLYKDPENYNTYSCTPTSYLVDQLDAKEDPTNIFTYETGVKMADKTEKKMDLTTDCNTAKTLAGAALILTAFTLI